MNEAATQYVARGRKFLAQASEELARDDLEQASEKGWGAAAQMMKAVAAERGWRHGQHRVLFDVAQRLAEEVDDEAIYDSFVYANSLHANFYEGFLRPEDVDRHLQRVDELVERVETVLVNGSP